MAPVVILNDAKSFSKTDRESSFGMVWYDWIMIWQAWYYTTMHLEALQASFLSETNLYLGCTCVLVGGGHPGFGIKMTPPPPPNIILTPETDSSP